MPRPRILRRVLFEPNINYFKPAGVPLSGLEEVVLTIDEFEAVRLKDFEGVDQEKAAKKMKISQPTFHRLILSARKKIAEAIVQGKAIRIEGGHYKMAARQGMGRGRGAGMGAGAGRGMGRGRMAGGPPAVCICPKCGAELPKQRGIPCSQMKCPKCNVLMVRK
ncbi:DUF134 domain-containing protein [Candidatus Woesearchaeota archaeon]|nr:DUF134 domain-containing protein [Candidatus Woesearchaeota archaeon]